MTFLLLAIPFTLLYWAPYIIAFYRLKPAKNVSEEAGASSLGGLYALNIFAFLIVPWFLGMYIAFKGVKNLGK